MQREMPPVLQAKIEADGLVGTRIALCVHTCKRSWQLRAALPCILIAVRHLTKWFRVYVADFNSDGNDEILLGTHDGLLHVYEQEEDVWRHADTIDLGSAPVHCAAVLRSIDVAPYLLL